MKPKPSPLTLKLFFIAIPILGFLTGLALLPRERFVFRPWELLFLGSNKTSPFYPNQTLVMTETGDLAQGTENRVPKRIRFQTDEWGYRNTSPHCKIPVAVILGDSMAVGGALSQEDTIAEKLSRATGECVLSFGGGSMAYAINTVYGLGLRPKWVILALTQRTAGRLKAFPNPGDRFKYGAHLSPALNRFMAELLTFRKNLYWNFRARHGLSSALDRTINGAPEAPPLKDGTGSQMLFFQDDWLRRVSASEMDRDLAVLDQFSANLAPLGARLAFTYVPNKSTIYPGNFTDADADFIDRFNPKATLHRARFIDLFTPFREDWANGIPSHHTDDTHWNPHGVDTFVGKLTQIMK